eukprot:SAG11_NODE_470_length_9205_cov_4.727872_2_plen_267_part_00
MPSGIWYSTLSQGECGSSKPGSTCSWRIAQTVKRISKRCQEAHVLAKVQEAGKACFEGCPEGATNQSTRCWTNCFYDTVIGPKSNRTAYSGKTQQGMDATVLTRAWEAAFESSDATKGGCPPLKSDDHTIQTTGARSGESTTPPAMCAAAMDRFCNGPALQRCISAIKSNGGLVPLVALFDSNPEHAASAWRCYSPSALTHASAAAPKHAVWLFPCETHGLGGSSYWTKSQLNDTVLSDAFDAWFGGKLDAHSRAWLGHSIGDGCK